MSRKTLEMMQQSDQVVHVIPVRAARSLHRRGLVRFTAVQPVPTDGIAVNLTVLGRSWRPKTVARAPEPAPEQATE